MAKTKQVMKLVHHGIFTVIYHEDANNPYWIYHEIMGHKHIVNKYADLYSCIYFFLQAV